MTVLQKEKNCNGSFKPSEADTNRRKRDLIAESNFLHKPKKKILLPVDMLGLRS